MGLGRLNPGCGGECDGCFFCCGKRTARLRITGGVGCIANLNGDYLIPRFYKGGDDSIHAPFGGNCGYIGWIGEDDSGKGTPVIFDCGNPGGCCSSLATNECTGGIADTTGAALHYVWSGFFYFVLTPESPLLNAKTLFRVYNSDTGGVSCSPFFGGLLWIYFLWNKTGCISENLGAPDSIQFEGVRNSFFSITSPPNLEVTYDVSV